MKYQYEDLYKKLEIDVPVTMDRFMNNEDMYVRFLKKFVDNTQFAELHQIIDDQKWEDALMTSHNLKSFTGNLSLIGLHTLLSSQVTAFREGRYDDAADMMKKIDGERDNVLSVLKKFGIE